MNEFALKLFAVFPSISIQQGNVITIRYAEGRLRIQGEVFTTMQNIITECNFIMIVCLKMLPIICLHTLTLSTPLIRRIECSLNGLNIIL